MAGRSSSSELCSGSAARIPSHIHDCTTKLQADGRVSTTYVPTHNTCIGAKLRGGRDWQALGINSSLIRPCFTPQPPRRPARRQRPRPRRRPQLPPPPRPPPPPPAPPRHTAPRGA